ncbi:MAG: DUF368 domain-containing protein [Clostridia bacterium]
MKKIIEILKGVMIGIGNVIPGVSGGTIAVVMGIYDKLIDAVVNIFKHPILTLKSMWVYILGILIGIILSIFGVTYLLENYAVETTFLFVGVIIGAVPFLMNNVKDVKIKISDTFFFMLFLVIVIGLPFISAYTNFSGNTNVIILFIVGIIAAGTMVIPGVSGSMVLMTLGYYDKIMFLIKDTIEAFFNFNIPLILSNCIILVPFGIGVILGIILVAKLIKWLLSKYSSIVHFSILGLVIASPFAVIVNLNLSNLSIITVIVSVIMFVIGGVIAVVFSKLDK